MFAESGPNRLKGENVNWEDFIETLLHAEPTFPVLHEFDMGFAFIDQDTGLLETVVFNSPTNFEDSYRVMDAALGAYICDQPPGRIKSDVRAYRKFQNLIERNRKKKDIY